MKETDKTLHETLRELVMLKGQELLQDYRLNGFVADVLGTRHKFHLALRYAYEINLWKRLTNEVDLTKEDYLQRLDSFKSTIVCESPLRPQTCQYLVDCFAFAIGLISSVEEEQEEMPGEFKFLDDTDGKYCGYRSDEGAHHGLGILQSDDGRLYAGEWKYGLRIGAGIDLLPHRERYIGEWRMDKPDGIGTKVYEDGIRYSGQWKNGKRNGCGTIYFPNGESLSALFKNDVLVESFGIYRCKDRTLVFGKMTINGPTGICSHVKGEDLLVEEYWEDGKLVE